MSREFLQKKEQKEKAIRVVMHITYGEHDALALAGVSDDFFPLTPLSGVLFIGR